MHNKPKHLHSIVLLLLTSISILWLCAQGYALQSTDDGVDLPTIPDEFRCPVLEGASLTQGNNGKVSHNDKWNRYAFDYNCLPGTPVVAARSGVVVNRKTDSNIGGDDRKYLNDANFILIQHAKDSFTKYLHLQKNMSLVRIGEFVLQGEIIGFSGTTGFSSGPHLHFNSSQEERGTSVSISFVDFASNNGIPDIGDVHDAPKPCIVPQNIITLYKRDYRYTRIPLQEDWPDIGLKLLSAQKKRKAYPEYYYHKVLVSLRKQFHTEIEANVKAMEDKEALTVDDAWILKRYLAALDKVKEAKLLKSRCKKLELKLPGDITAQLPKSKSDWKKLVDAMSQESKEDVKKATGLYAALLKKSKGRMKDYTRTRLKAIIKSFHESYSGQLERLKDEAERSLKTNHPSILKDTLAVGVKAHSLVKFWIHYYPEDKDEVETLLQSIQTDHNAILKLTGGRKSDYLR